MAKYVRIYFKSVHTIQYNTSATYINFVLKIHQIQVLTEPLCRAQVSFNALPNNERGTKYRGLTYSARQNCP